MRSIIIIILSFILFACSAQDAATTSSSTSKTEASRRKMFGKVVVKSLPNNDSQTTTPVLYFDLNGAEYFIKISEGTVKKEMIQKYTYKEVDILGEIKTGLWSSGAVQAKDEETADIEEGEYIVIYKIFE